MKITVTTEHIQNGVKKNSKECMVFLALRDAGFPVEACAFTIWMDKQGNHHSLPDSVSKQISRFDEGYKVEPFEFQITWPEE